MKFIDSSTYKELNPEKLVLPFGEFYLTDKFVVAEIYDGEHVDWDKIELLFIKIAPFYKNTSKLAYISHRINDYSVNPQIWSQWEDTFDFIVASAIVIYNSTTLMNASIEKYFANKSLKRCRSLEEGINWVNNLKEFN
ncbi:hypothetical protein LG651_12605 [Tamlana sp. 62-3]|uniref:STAS/SEC14 domain-containing protein n=1 Tax=Neotamlana sargassicola TaxID=2883125 RepID=A0A9X1L7P1_9FLAO|nr:hypothetical protein [Tamlana sargassicola]MCB4809091.1 hypothetical protein [Tamlana sargassicola]